MEIYKYFPVASDRMGVIWTLSSIKDSYIIEFGPAGTTHYAVESIGKLNGEDLSNMYSTHMSESDLTFGNYERLEKSILEVDINKKPKYIFVMTSSVTAIIGADIKSICSSIQDKVSAKLIPIEISGLKEDYNKGVEEALEILVKNIVKESNKKTTKFNIIGTNIDSYNFESDSKEIIRMMEKFFSREVNTVFTAYTSIDEIERASEASFNLVLRKEGLKAAEYMKEKYSIPYIYKKPMGVQETLKWLKEVESLIGHQYEKDKVNKEIKYIKEKLFLFKMMTRDTKNKDVCIFGDYDTVSSMKEFVQEVGLNVHRAEVLYKTKTDREDIKINSGELERINYLKETELFVLLGDGVSLDMESKAKKSIQISNPNLEKINIYHHKPYVGFRGVLVLLEELLNR